MNRAYRSASEETECSWLNSRMEELFSDTLPHTERERATAHVAQCGACQAEVESLRAIDPLVKNVMRYRADLVGKPPERRIHFGRAFGAAAALVAAVALAVFLWNPAQPTTEPSIALEPGTEKIEPLVGTIPKGEDPAKPDSTPAPSTALLTGASRDKSSVQGPASKFAVINAAGYELTLADFRGQILLIGVLSPKQPQGAANLEKLYRTFGTKLRLLAIAGSRKEPAPKDTTFQLLYNNGSDLLGAQASEYAVVSGNGALVSKGSLLGDPAAILNAVGAALKTLETTR